MANATAGSSKLSNVDIQVNLPELPRSLKHISPCTPLSASSLRARNMLTCPPLQIYSAQLNSRRKTPSCVTGVRRVLCRAYDPDSCTIHVHRLYGTQRFTVGLYFTAKQGVAAKGGKETRPFLFAVLELLEKVCACLVFSMQ